MKIAIVDGQGGGIGKVLVEKLRRELSDEIEIIALGTNATATAIMMKAGANEGASGENAITYCADKVDIIVGVISIIVSNAMMGELTPNIARAICESPAKKVLLPLNRNNIEIVGVKSEPLPHLIDQLVELIKKSI